MHPWSLMGGFWSPCKMIQPRHQGRRRRRRSLQWRSSLHQPKRAILKHFAESIQMPTPLMRPQSVFWRQMCGSLWPGTGASESRPELALKPTAALQLALQCSVQKDEQAQQALVVIDVKWHGNTCVMPWHGFSAVNRFLFMNLIIYHSNLMPPYHPTLWLV